MESRRCWSKDCSDVVGVEGASSAGKEEEESGGKDVESGEEDSGEEEEVRLPLSAMDITDTFAFGCGAAAGGGLVAFVVSMGLPEEAPSRLLLSATAKLFIFDDACAATVSFACCTDFGPVPEEDVGRESGGEVEESRTKSLPGLIRPLFDSLKELKIFALSSFVFSCACKMGVRPAGGVQSPGFKVGLLRPDKPSC